MSRRRARRQAVEILYAADVRGVQAMDVLLERRSDDEEVVDYASVLVQGVEDRRAEIDGALGRHAKGWTLDRMSAVDRNVLRVAVFELLAEDAPPAVVMDEAVEIAKTFSGEQGGRFVNGVLGGVLRARGDGGAAAT